MFRRTLPLLLLAAAAVAQPKYAGPRPPKSDLLYLKHADSLVPTEASEATEEKQKKDDILYWIAGAASSAKTPLASPIFLIQASKISPDSLRLFKLDVKNGRREILFGPKKQPRAFRMEATRLTSDNLYKLEVDDSLEPGEYSISPEGSNQVFCFAVY
ncbi:MAG TPA: hypothetical protein VGF59_19910 [Bryobacteraceae bacterium]|jgi:hypothetical protein